MNRPAVSARKFYERLSQLIEDPSTIQERVVPHLISNYNEAMKNQKTQDPEGNMKSYLKAGPQAPYKELLKRMKILKARTDKMVKEKGEASVIL